MFLVFTPIPSGVCYPREKILDLPNKPVGGSPPRLDIVGFRRREALPPSRAPTAADEFAGACHAARHH